MLAKDAKYDFSKGAAVLGAAQAELAKLGKESEDDGDATKGERIYLGTIIDGIVGDMETFSGRLSLVMDAPCPRQPLESANFLAERSKFEDEAKRYSHDFNVGAAKANAVCEAAAEAYEISKGSDGFEKAGEIAKAARAEIAKAADVIDEFVDKHGHDQEMILGSKTTCGEYLDYQRSIVKYHELSATLKDVGRDFGEAANTEYRKEGPIPKRTLSSFFYKTERMAFERDIAADTRMADAELGGGWKGKAMLEGDMFRIEIMAGALGRADADATVERAAAAYEARHDETEKPIDPYEANDKSEL